MPETTERTEEYRVVTSSGSDAEFASPPLLDRGGAERLLAARRAYLYPAFESRLQSSTTTVTTTPWADLDEGEGK